MGVEVVPLPRGRTLDAAMVLAEAFARDDLFLAIFPEGGRHLPALTDWMACGVRSAEIDGLVETTPRLAAVSLWFPPGYRPRIGTYLRVSWLVGKMLRSATPTQIGSALAWLSRWEQRRVELVAEPHWYLEAVGVDPHRQRFGVGPALVQHGLARADRDGVATYLETKTDENVSPYRKLGFEVIHYTPPEEEPLAVPVWRMLRRPARP